MPLAVVCKEFGPPEGFSLEEFDPGDPKPGEVRIAIKAAGISFVDVLATTGNYQHEPSRPFIPGSEAAGVVESVGDGVSHVAPGDRVFCSGPQGTLCEANIFPAEKVSKVPDGVSLENASLMVANYQTAYYGLADRGRAKVGETLLVLGAAGGTGLAAVQIGKHLGLRVIASASSAEKRRVALDGGADVAIETGAQDWRGQVIQANDGRPVDLIFDPVGGDLTELAFRNLDYDGRHLIVGFPAGIASMPTNLPLLKSASIVGVHLGDAVKRRPEKAAQIREEVLELAGLGILRPAIAARYAIQEFVPAMNAAFSGKAAGRILLTMG
ncbi:MAG: NADPH:quinone oxidoreductase family protein [Sphingomonadaceae bacterium]|nr:NADPH:quinone oxidoreductase family protein [Sphingomonadaceae bacterium]